MDCLIIVDYLICRYVVPVHMDCLIIVDYLRLSLCSYGLPDHRGLS